METLDNLALARLCRAQAALASTAETRVTLLELAVMFDAAAAAPPPSIVAEPVVALGEEP